MDSKSQDSSAHKQKFSVLGSGNFMSYMGRENQSINQSINQFNNVNTWDGVARITQDRGSCIKRMTIKILSQ